MQRKMKPKRKTKTKNHPQYEEFLEIAKSVSASYGVKASVRSYVDGGMGNTFCSLEIVLGVATPSVKWDQPLEFRFPLKTGEKHNSVELRLATLIDEFRTGTSLPEMATSLKSFRACPLKSQEEYGEEFFATSMIYQSLICGVCE